MTEEGRLDYYEVLQVSSNAEPDTIQRVYRLLAQRFHPDNRDSGNDARFREIHEAYTVLSDPEKRARYDIHYQQRRQERWRLVTSGAESENDFESELMVRLRCSRRCTRGAGWTRSRRPSTRPSWRACSVGLANTSSSPSGI